MANPQIENGHIDIAHDLSEALMRINLSGYQYRIIWCVFRKTYGWHKSTDKISLTQFEKMTGLKNKYVCKAIKDLEDRNMIIVDRNNHINIYKFNSDYDTWEPRDSIKTGNTPRIGTPKIGSSQIKEQGLPKMGVKTLPKMGVTKEKKETLQKKHIYRSDEPKEQIEEIIMYLNKSASKNFRSNKADTIKSIKARLNEGYKIDDLKKVIDIKTSQWKETEWDKYLRPKTLFGNKFEDYLNEKPIKKKGAGKNGYIEGERTTDWFDKFQERKSNESKESSRSKPARD